MSLKADVTAKIAALKAYSVARSSATAALFVPLEEVLTAYFDTGTPEISKACEDVVQYMYNDISRRTTIYENEFEAHMATDFPTGYEDVTECFADISGILTVSNSAFYAAFVFGADPVTGVTGSLSNSYLDAWTTLLTEAQTGDLAKVKALAAWCQNSGGSSDMIDLLEDRGNEIYSMTREEVAHSIYVDRKMLDVITDRELSTYVPTYIS